MGLLGAHIECRCSHVHGEDVTITDVTIKTPDRNGTGDVNDVMPGSDGLRILGFEKKTVEFWTETNRVDFWTWVRSVHLGIVGCACALVGSESWWCMNSQHSKKLCLSLVMSENIKLKKVNKSFVPEPKESRQSVSRVFWIPMHMNILLSRLRT